VFTKDILDDLCGIFSSVCADFEAELLSSTARTIMFICW
jgi:hypothetical protein